MGLVPFWQPSTLCFAVSFHSCIVCLYRMENKPALSLLCVLRKVDRTSDSFPSLCRRRSDAIGSANRRAAATRQLVSCWNHISHCCRAIHRERSGYRWIISYALRRWNNKLPDWQFGIKTATVEKADNATVSRTTLVHHLSSGVTSGLASYDKKVKFSHTRYRERWARSRSRCTGSQTAGDLKWITPWMFRLALYKSDVSVATNWK